MRRKKVSLVRETAVSAAGVASSEAPTTEHIKIYDERSELVSDVGQILATWNEGQQSEEAKVRYEQITEALNNGFLQERIEKAKSATAAESFSLLSATDREALGRISESINAQQGRALVEILVLQLAVKAICPGQDVRLHKGSRSTRSFSWSEGISMRALDASFVAPALREHNLIRMNQYGAFMTRSFAENYPYTKFYKAEIAGAKWDWLDFVERVESNVVGAEPALMYILHTLWLRSEAFRVLGQETLKAVVQWLTLNPNSVVENVADLMASHIDSSDARARLLEVSIHSMLQALEDCNALTDLRLKPLMPMRTANLKHGNIGDVEIYEGERIEEAWDAKYDNAYLSDALDELRTKLEQRKPSDLTFGYVLMPTRREYPEDQRKIHEIEEDFDIEILTLSFSEWVREQESRASEAGTQSQELARLWLKAYAESLCLARSQRAPIDEPTFDWVATLKQTLG